MSRMFPFITHTVNPLGGGPCPYECTYCWATNLKDRYSYKKYQGDWRIIPKELKKYDSKAFVFPFDMTEIGAPSIPAEIIDELLEWIGKQSCQMLLLTKNPRFYYDWRNYIPENAIIGCTIESDTNIMSDFSQAPAGYHRLWWMQEIGTHLPNKRFISIEPIMKFTPDFEREIMKINPWAVAVGYDNYNNGLPEPNLAATENLIKELEFFTTVYRKTMREPSVASKGEKMS